ncbi:hypothetical protein ACFX2C_043123 [Malus domestica]
MADAAGSASAKRMCSVPERLQLHGAMLALQFGYAEKNDRPAITLNFLIQFFLLALVGITANQGFYLLGLDNTSPTFAYAIQNSVPAITFLMAAILRIEHVRLDPKRWYCQGARNGLLRRRSVCNHALQGPHHIQPNSSTPDDEIDEQYYYLCNLNNIFVSNSVDSLIAWRCKGEELDSGLSLPDRTLPVVVRLARVAGAGSEEISGPALSDIVHVFLWADTVHHNCCSFLERRSGLDLSQRW